MDTNIQTFNSFLKTKYPNLDDIKHTFERCSKYGKDTCLVNSQIYTINFDKLTKWYCGDNCPQSADSLSFSDEYLYLIEFKSGDQIKSQTKIDSLIKNVLGKINDSDETLSSMFNEAYGNKKTRIKQNFCLVVDSKQMMVTPLTLTLASLSKINNVHTDPKEKILFEKVYPNLKEGIKDPEHYSKIEIWYSEIFDSYLRTKKIKSSVQNT